MRNFTAEVLEDPKSADLGVAALGLRGQPSLPGATVNQACHGLGTGKKVGLRGKTMKQIGKILINGEFDKQKSGISMKQVDSNRDTNLI